jgi:hypothetical protein
MSSMFNQLIEMLDSYIMVLEDECKRNEGTISNYLSRKEIIKAKREIRKLGDIEKELDNDGTKGH